MSFVGDKARKKYFLMQSHFGDDVAADFGPMRHTCNKDVLLEMHVSLAMS